MFSDRTDLGIFRYVLADVERQTNDRLRALRRGNDAAPLEVPEIDDVVDDVWAAVVKPETFGAFCAGLDADKLLPELKEQLRNSFNIYSRPPGDICTPTDAESDWVTKADRQNRRYWPLMHKRLMDSPKLSSATVASIDLESERILNRLHDPRDPSPWQTRGLVVGQVQSGKTTNYSALIAKAADAGYRLIIVLSGIHNDLRFQTQERLDEDFVGYHQVVVDDKLEREYCGVSDYAELYDKARAPQCATTLASDFKGGTFTAEGLPWLFVVKKNTRVFKKLINWMETNIPDRAQWPLLIIDDEADQASVNTSKGENLATATNRAIRKILTLFPRSAFVGYTATPFANIFISTTAETKKLGRDLFPKDFIAQLPKASNYFGPQEFFGPEDAGGLDLFLPISEASVDAWFAKKDPSRKGGRRLTENVPPEARTALLQFILSTALRLWRWKRKNPQVEGEDVDLSEPSIKSSMLVHVSHRVAEQRQLAGQFSRLISEVRDEAGFTQLESGGLRREFEALFIEQRDVVTPEIRARRAKVDIALDWDLPRDFDEALPLVLEVIEDLQILLVNGEVAQKTVLRPDPEAFSRKRTLSSVYIGGNKLSRGLTLPDLCMSLFLRTSTMYDTLLQMGRWFGYRDGYVDLCRIATTITIISWFRAINEACNDFENQIGTMNAANRTPENFRLKVLTHPQLLITARNKMRHAANAQVNFTGQRLESRNFMLELSEGDSFGTRISAPALRLHEAAERHGRLHYRSDSFAHVLPKGDVDALPDKQGESRPEGRLWKEVPTADVIDFLRDFNPTGSAAPERAALVKQLEKMAEKEQLTHWNVFVPGAWAEGPFGLRPVVRRLCKPQLGGEITLKVLKTGGHEFAGVPPGIMEYVRSRYGIDPQDRGEFFRRVREAAGADATMQRTGHLILYVIALADPVPGSREGTVRQTGPGSVEDPVCTYYLWLPASPGHTGLDSVTFNTTIADLDEPDEDDETDQEDEE